MAVYGYVRISSADQNEDRQLISMGELNIPAKHIITDRISGKDFDRPHYQALVKKLKPGDLVYITSIDRLGRNYNEIQNQWRIITKERGADIAVLDMPLLDTRNGKDLMGAFIADLVLQILSFVAHSERDNIKKRQAEGIAAAKARGVQFGRLAKTPSADFPDLVDLWKSGRLRTKDFVEQSGLTESSLYRRLRKLKVVKGWLKEKPP